MCAWRVVSGVINGVYCCVTDVEQVTEPTCVWSSQWCVLEESVHNAAEDQRVPVAVQRRSERTGR